MLAVSNGNTDPYAGLLDHFNKRQSEYLRRVTTDAATFAEDPVLNGVALRRGFIAGRGPKPECSVADQDSAIDAGQAYLAVWTDSPCMRAASADGELWDGEDVRAAIARLTAYPDPTAFHESLVIPAEPPDPSTVGLRFRTLFKLVRQLGVIDRHGFRSMIRILLADARDTQIGLPDFNPDPVFDPGLIERVVVSLDGTADPDPSPAAKLANAAEELQTLTVEGQPSPIGANLAKRVVDGIFQVLAPDVAGDLVDVAASRGRPAPYVVDYHGGYEPPPTDYEPPPSTYEPPPSNYEPPPSSQDRPTGNQDPANPHPPPPRGTNTILLPVWNALNALAWLGWMEIDQWKARQAILGISQWIWDAVPPTKPSDNNNDSLIGAVFARDWVPHEFLWPPYTRVGLYWWRAVLKQQCVEQCLALNETADFHSTDLIRLLRLFPGDSRIPDYVTFDAEVALLYFKYWLDEPPAKDGQGNDKAEMTCWSENHQILFGQSQLLAGLLLYDQKFPRAGTDPTTGQPRTGASHVREAIPRVEAWLDNRLRFGFSEWNAPGYYNEDFPALFNLVDFANPDDPAATDPSTSAALGRIKIKAAMVLDIMVFDCARYTCRGSFGVTAGRAYWEHKAYGWEQSIGNTIEILFGTRGDFKDLEPAAVALATSTYDVPEALLAIGLDRQLADRQQPLIDRTRVSITFDEAANWGIGFDSEQDTIFWWGNEAYFDHTLDATKRVVQAHPNLNLSDPFKLLYAIPGGWLARFVIDLISAVVDAVQAATGTALVAVLPFPLDLVALGFEGGSIIDGIVGFFKDVWDAVKHAWNAIFDPDANDTPSIPDIVVQQTLEKILVAFNQGTVLTRANNYAYSNGDALLSSVQNHLPGLTGFQKHPWQANLGCDACVWTSARYVTPDAGSFIAGAEEFVVSIAGLHFQQALLDLAAPAILSSPLVSSDPFGHDGPNYWTGSLAMPMIVQHENACIVAYDVPTDKRVFSGASTHAWFPTAMFDGTDKLDQNGGTWFFGYKNSFDPLTGSRLGCGYVALFSAVQADWTSESGNVWNGKEILVNEGSNVWVCLIGNEAQFGSYDTFKQETSAAYLSVSGVDSLNGIEASFDIPRANAPAGRSPRLELFYGDKKGRFAGDDLQLDEFPRFDNRYTSLQTKTGGNAQQSPIDFGARRYTITHPATGLSLEHDLDGPSRSHTSQKTAGQAPQPRRLVAGSLTPRRPVPRHPVHPLSHPQRPHLGR